MATNRVQKEEKNSWRVSCRVVGVGHALRSQPPDHPTTPCDAPETETPASATVSAAATPVDQPPSTSSTILPELLTQSPAQLTSTAPPHNPSTTPHAARGPNFTHGTPSQCTRCNTIFPSRTQLLTHLHSCRTKHPVTSLPPTTSTPPSRKRSSPLPPAPPPSTFTDAITLPPAKRRHFTHAGALSTTEAVQVGDTLPLLTLPLLTLPLLTRHYSLCLYSLCLYSLRHYSRRHYSLHHYSLCHYSLRHYSLCHYSLCHYSLCHYSLCPYSLCHYSLCHYSLCHYSLCHYSLLLN